MSDELLPCDHCGFVASETQKHEHIINTHDEGYSVHALGCPSCGATGPFGPEDDMEDAWNRRAPSPDLARVTAELEAAKKQARMFELIATGDESTFEKLANERDSLRAEVASLRKHLRDANRGAETNAHVNRSLAEKQVELLAALASRDQIIAEKDAALSRIAEHPLSYWSTPAESEMQSIALAAAGGKP